MRLKATALFGLILTAGLLLTPNLTRAQSETKFGVPVYAGAKLDADTTTILAKMVGQAAAYRSPDALAKITAFYSKLPGVKVVHTDDKGAMFNLNGVNITLQNPWMDMKTGALNKDTLISIVKE